jgi:hypothetical protein
VISVGIVLASGCSDKEASASDTVRTFDRFPIVWLGESWDQDGDGTPETPLRSAKEFRTPGGRFAEPTHGFDMLYGTCTPAPDQTEGGCSAPLYIVIYPACETPPLAEEAKVGTVEIRGVEAVITASASVWLETADFTAQITHAAPLKPGDPQDHVDKAIELAHQLRGANDQAAAIAETSGFAEKDGDTCL